MKFMSKESFKDFQLQQKIETFLKRQEKTAYSKYKVMKWLISHNLWEEFKLWLENMKFKDYWDVPQEFEDEDELFQEGLNAFQLRFGLSDDEIATMKDECRK